MGFLSTLSQRLKKKKKSKKHKKEDDEGEKKPKGKCRKTSRCLPTCRCTCKKAGKYSPDMRKEIRESRYFRKVLHRQRDNICERILEKIRIVEKAQMRENNYIIFKAFMGLAQFMSTMLAAVVSLTVQLSWVPLLKQTYYVIYLFEEMTILYFLIASYPVDHWFFHFSIPIILFVVSTHNLFDFTYRIYSEIQDSAQLIYTNATCFESSREYGCIMDESTSVGYHPIYISGLSFFYHTLLFVSSLALFGTFTGTISEIKKGRQRSLLYAESPKDPVLELEAMTDEFNKGKSTWKVMREKQKRAIERKFHEVSQDSGRMNRDKSKASQAQQKQQPSLQAREHQVAVIRPASPKSEEDVELATSLAPSQLSRSRIGQSELASQAVTTKRDQSQAAITAVASQSQVQKGAAAASDFSCRPPDDEQSARSELKSASTAASVLSKHGGGGGLAATSQRNEPPKKSKEQPKKTTTKTKSKQKPPRSDAIDSHASTTNLQVKSPVQAKSPGGSSRKSPSSPSPKSPVAKSPGSKMSSPASNSGPMKSSTAVATAKPAAPPTKPAAAAKAQQKPAAAPGSSSSSKKSQ